MTGALFDGVLAGVKPPRGASHGQAQGLPARTGGTRELSELRHGGMPATALESQSAAQHKHARPGAWVASRQRRVPRVGTIVHVRCSCERGYVARCDGGVATCLRICARDVVGIVETPR